jgi:uncharacterized DUF497 family protein
MRFEWDERKNEENIRKHHLDFEDAPTVFGSPMLVRRDTRFDYGEERWTGVGMVHTRIVVIVYVEKNEETIRIISMRKALKYEQKEYRQFVAIGLEGG